MHTTQISVGNMNIQPLLNIFEANVSLNSPPKMFEKAKREAMDIPTERIKHNAPNSAILPGATLVFEDSLSSFSLT